MLSHYYASNHLLETLVRLELSYYYMSFGLEAGKFWSRFLFGSAMSPLSIMQLIVLSYLRELTVGLIARHIMV